MLETNIIKIFFRIYVLSSNRQIETKDFQSSDILFRLKQSVVTMNVKKLARPCSDKYYRQIIDRYYCKLDYGTPKNGSVVLTKIISCSIIFSTIYKLCLRFAGGVSTQSSIYNN